MSEPYDPITPTESAPIEGGQPAPWSSTWRVLTPRMRAAGGTLGMVEMTLPPGGVGCPFHWHAREDELFYVLEGRGVLRYGSTLREIGPGDCIACPAGTQTAHQIANPFDDDLRYLAIGPREPDEVCGYPDNGKLLVRTVQALVPHDPRSYFDGEPDPPVIFERWATRS